MATSTHTNVVLGGQHQRAEGSAGKHSTTTRQAAMSAADFRRKAECERAAAVVIESFIDEPKSEGDLLGLVAQVERRHYSCIVEERSLAGRCGYPLCSRLLPSGDGLRQRWKIDTARNKVFETKDRNMFCSDACFTASNHFAQHIDETPLWVRDDDRSEEPPRDRVTLLPYGPRRKDPNSKARSLNRSMGGKEVPDRKNSATGLDGTSVRTQPKKVSTECVSIAEVPGDSYVSNESRGPCRTITAGVEVLLTCPKLELEKSVELLNELDKAEGLNLKEEGNSAKTITQNKYTAEKIEKVCVSSQPNENIRNSTIPEQETAENFESVDTSGDVSSSLSKSLTEISIDVNLQNTTSVAKTAKRDLLVTKSTSPKKATVKKHSARKDPQPYESMYKRVLSALVEWRTIDTLTHVFGAEEVARLHGHMLPSEKPPRQTSQTSEAGGAAKIQRYLRGDPSSLHEDPDVRIPKPRSEKSTEAARKHRVRFEGSSSSEATKPTTAESGEASAAPAVDIALPTVDNREQMTIRRRILVDKLRLTANPLFPSILSVERAPLMNDLGALVCTFHLSSHNTMFRRPKEWTLALLALLHVLARRNAELKEALERPAFRAYASSMDSALAAMEGCPLDVFVSDTLGAVLAPVPMCAVHTL